MPFVCLSCLRALNCVAYDFASGVAFPLCGMRASKKVFNRRASQRLDLDGFYFGPSIFLPESSSKCLVFSRVHF